MKNIFLITFLLFATLSCKAQVIGTLEQFEECSRRPDHSQNGCPDLENVTYVKDTNNRLDQFVGTWKGSYNGKSYEIKLEKKLKFGSYSIKWDKLVGRILVKDFSGNTIYNSMPKPDNDTYFRGDIFQGRTYNMNFVGNYDCLESGSVYIATKPDNPNEMTLFYSQDTDGLLFPEKCPNYSSFVPILPTEKMT